MSRQPSSFAPGRYALLLSVVWFVTILVVAGTAFSVWLGRANWGSGVPPMNGVELAAALAAIVLCPVGAILLTWRLGRLPKPRSDDQLKP